MPAVLHAQVLGTTSGVSFTFSMAIVNETCSLGCAITIQGRGVDLSFFDCSSPFCFLLIEFYLIFSMFYKILPYYVYYYSILIRL